MAYTVNSKLDIVLDKFRTVHSKFIVRWLYYNIENTVVEALLLSSEDLAYISGFFDGNSNVVAYAKKVFKNKVKVSITIYFSQLKDNSDVLYYIKSKLKLGYISSLKNNVIELRINGFSRILRVINLIKKYVIVKKSQLVILELIINKLIEKSIKQMSKQEKIFIIDNIILLQSFNQSLKQKQDRNFLIAAFKISTVTTLQ